MINGGSFNPCDDSQGDCGKAKKLVDSYIDGVLNPQEFNFVQSHLDDCPPCADGFSFEKTFHDRMRAINPVRMPDEVKSHIMLSLGFPGMGEPMTGAYSAMGISGSPEAPTRDTGIPNGDIPRGTIPGHKFFDRGDASSEGSDD
jgi:hypothetical protein